MNYSNFKQGDIVAADVVFAEQTGVKRRPAVVISNTEYNSQTEDFILLKISSKSNLQEYDISLTNEDMLEGELQMESKIMVDNPVTVYREMIHQKIGRVSTIKLTGIKQKMRELYEL